MGGYGVNTQSVLHGEGETNSPFTVWYTVISSSEISVVGMPKGFGNVNGERDPSPPGQNLGRYPLFYESLELSIVKDGFRNPILCWNKDRLYNIYGTSRLYIARKLDMDIPTFIVDFTGKWELGEHIKTEEQALSKFTEEPEFFQFTDKTFNFCNERWKYDPLVRKAQGRSQFRLKTGEVYELGPSKSTN